MKYGLSLPAFGDFGDPRTLAVAAREAEQVGWDGFFIWDHLIFDPSYHPMVDPWIGLAAVATATSRIRLGTMLTPLARRRPWIVARQSASLDLLSGGRLILGVGLGDPVQWDFGFFGEEEDAKIRATQLDESLDILTGLWSGQRFSYQGKHYTLHEVIFQPAPLQQPRIPIWVGGWWPHKPPLRRAARWDGTCAAHWGTPLTPDDWREIRAYIAQHRLPAVQGEPFDIVHAGETTGTDRAQDSQTVAAYADAGVTWWIEGLNPWRFGDRWEEPISAPATAQMWQRIRQGPPAATR